MIKVSSKGDFSTAFKYLESLKQTDPEHVFRKYGEAGVAALAAATPVDTGRTADSWSYTVNKGRSKTTITFNNSNVNDGVNVAIILQYGHATGNGAYVEGIDYVNPAISSIFDKMAKDLWAEVTAL